MTGILNEMDREFAQWPNVGAIVGGLAKVRRYEQGFLYEPTPETAGRLRMAANEFDFVLMGGPFDSDTAGRLTKGLVSYLGLLGGFTQTVETANAADADLRTVFTDLQLHLGAVRDTFEEVQTELLTQGERSRDNIQALTFFGGAVVLGLFLFASWAVVRSILRPLNSIEEAMRQLADGHQQVSIPGLGRKDEVGRMAQAIQVFRP